MTLQRRTPLKAKKSTTRRTPLKAQKKSTKRAAPLKNDKPLQRETPLKNKKPLEQGATPLKSKKPLDRGAALKNKKPLDRGTPLKAKKVTKRATPLKAKPQAKKSIERAAAQPQVTRASKLPAAPKRSTRGPARDAKYLAEVRQLPCAHCRTSDGTIQPHHFEQHHGLALKCSDYDTVPLCHSCHHVWWHGKGHLEGLGKAGSLEFMRSWAQAYRAGAGGS